MMSKSLVAYFSRRGKNYTNNGIAELKEGNTEIVAKKLAGLTGSCLLYTSSSRPERVAGHIGTETRPRLLREIIRRDAFQQRTP